MTTSERKSATRRASAKAVAAATLARNVSFSDSTLLVELQDGRRVSVPMEWFPRLAAARVERPQGLDNWRLIGGGAGTHWPALDEDICVENLLANRSDLLVYHDAPVRDDGEHGPQTAPAANPRQRTRSRASAAAARVARDPRTGRFEQ